MVVKYILAGITFNTYSQLDGTSDYLSQTSPCYTFFQEATGIKKGVCINSPLNMLYITNVAKHKSDT